MHGTLYRIAFLFAIPLKLLADIYSYLYNANIPSAITIALPISLMAAIFYPPQIYKKSRSLIKITCLFLLLLIVSIITQIIFTKKSMGINSTTINSINTSLFLYIVYLVAGYGYACNENLSLAILKFSCLIGYTIIILTQIYIKDVWLTLNEYGAYLRIADLMCIISLICISKTKSVYIKITFSILSAISLLYIGSRSSLLFFLFSLGIGFILSIQRTNAMYIIFSIIGLIFIIFVSKNFLGNIENLFYETRIGQTMLTEGGGGVDERQRLLELGLERIEKNPLLGNWQNRLFNSNDGGDYIHNILFLWDDFGLTVFSLMAIIITLIYIHVKDNKNIFISTYLFITLSMLFARAYTFPYIFFVAGILSNKNTFIEKYQK